MRWKVVLTASLEPTQLEKDTLAEIGANLVACPCKTEDDIITSCHNADAVIIGASEPFSKRVIDALDNCRIISRMGIGYDNIDVEAATEKGIAVSTVPDYCIDEVSDHAMAFILALARKILPLNQYVKNGQWKPGSTNKFQIVKGTRRLREQTLGIIGLGKIGQALARKAKAFGLTVFAYDPYLSQEQAEKLGVKSAQLDELLKESDYISVHAPLTRETKHLLNLEAFKKMKPTAYFVNNARGGLVDEEALYTALSTGLIAGAGIDVTDPEPPRAENPLLHLDAIIITPHTAWHSQEASVELRKEAFEAVVQVLRGGWPRALANPRVRNHRRSG